MIFFLPLYIRSHTRHADAYAPTLQRRYAFFRLRYAFRAMPIRCFAIAMPCFRRAAARYAPRPPRRYSDAAATQLTIVTRAALLIRYAIRSMPFIQHTILRR